jgi:hypothetical protein
VGFSEAVLDVHCESEAEAFAEFPKGRTITIKDTARGEGMADGDNLLIGTVERHRFLEDTNLARVVVRDFLTVNQDATLKEGMLFVNQHLGTIITHLAAEAGITKTRIMPDEFRSKRNPQLIFAFWESGTKIIDALNEIGEAVHGKIYISPGIATPTLVFEFGCLYENWSSTALVNLGSGLDNVKNVNIDLKPRDYNVWTVKGREQELVTEAVYLATLFPDDPLRVPAAGLGVGDDLHIIEFDMPVLQIKGMNLEMESGLTFDETVWASNFVDNDTTGYLKNPFQVKVRITNSLGTPAYIWEWGLDIVGVHENIHEKSIDESTDERREWAIDNRLILALDGLDWPAWRANWQKALPNEHFAFDIISMDKHPYIGPRSSVSRLPDYIVELAGAKILVTSLTFRFHDQVWQIAGIGDRADYNPDEYDTSITRLRTKKKKDALEPIRPGGPGMELIHTCILYFPGTTVDSVRQQCHHNLDLEHYEVVYVPVDVQHLEETEELDKLHYDVISDIVWKDANSVWMDFYALPRSL